MIEIQSTPILKKAQENFWEDIRDVDWGGDAPEDRGTSDLDYERYLVDDFEPEPDPNIPPGPVDPADAGIMDTVQTKTYDNPFNLIAESLGYAPISFYYTTIKGADIGQRIVEPHDWKIAETGNALVVAYDLTPGIDDSNGRIRSFIIGNIHPGGVRYEGEVIPDRSFRDI